MENNAVRASELELPPRLRPKGPERLDVESLAELGLRSGMRRRSR